MLRSFLKPFSGYCIHVETPISLNTWWKSYITHSCEDKLVFQKTENKVEQQKKFPGFKVGCRSQFL